MKIVNAIGAGALLMATSVTAFADVESSDPIKLTLHDWSGQLLTTTIMGKVLESCYR